MAQDPGSRSQIRPDLALPDTDGWPVHSFFQQLITKYQLGARRCSMYQRFHCNPDRCEVAVKKDSRDKGTEQPRRRQTRQAQCDQWNQRLVAEGSSMLGVTEGEL